MKRCEANYRQESEERESDVRNSSQWDCSEQGEMSQGLCSDHKIEDLHDSLQKLRQFAGKFSEEEVGTVPTCVEEYCDKMRDYKIQSADEVVSIAQRRLNKMLRNKKIKRNWNNEDITLLVWLVSKLIEIRDLTHFSELEKEDWEYISSLISGATWQKCKFRWLGLKKVKLVSHKWSKLQSKLLSDIIAQTNKVNWKLVSEKLYEKNPSPAKVFRTAKQCREHWNCFLNPNIQKGPWTLQEDRRLLEYVLELQGSKKWSEISKFMEGRTENALKNRFNLLMNRQRKVSGHLTEKRLVKVCLNRLMLQEGQEERLSMPSALAIEPAEEGSQIVQRQISPSSRAPIVPTVIEAPQQSTVPTQFGSSFSNFFSYVPSNMGIGSTNPVYFGFVIPNQFL